MIYIGNDIVENARIKRLIKVYGNKFLNKIYSSKEIKSIKASNIHISLSGKFAAKEASAKALMSSGLADRVSFKDLQVLTKANGCPYVEWNCFNTCKIKNFKISISHSDQYANAIALIELFE